MQRDIDTEAPQIFNYETSHSGSKYLVLDGQQRLTSLYFAFKGTYNHKRLYIDALSGASEDKDPGDVYYDCQFLSDQEALDLNSNSSKGKRYFVPIQDLIRIDPVRAATIAYQKAQELALNRNLRHWDRENH